MSGSPHRYVRGDVGQIIARITRSRSRVILEDWATTGIPLGMSLSRDEALRLSGELARVANEISDVGVLYERLHRSELVGEEDVVYRRGP